MSSVNLTQNVADTKQISKPEGSEKASKPATGFKAFLNDRKEDLQISREMYNENLLRKHNILELFDGFYTMEGSVNDKAVFLKEKRLSGIVRPVYEYKGNIGEDKTELKLSHEFLSAKVEGKVGDKDVNLTIKPGFLGKYSISGTIDGKEIDIKKGASLDAAQGENDIITAAASLTGYKINIWKGEFGFLSASKQSQIDSERQMAASQSMQMHNNMQMQQTHMMMCGMM